MTQPDLPRRRVPLWVKLLLGVSLALNLAIVGFLAGVAMRKGGQREHFSSYGMPYIIALPKEDRRVVFDSVRRQTRAGDLPGRNARRAIYGEMVEALKAEPFDPAHIETILKRQTEGTLAVQGVAQQAWLEKIKSLTPEQRRAYAERLLEVLKRGPKRRSPKS